MDGVPSGKRLHNCGKSPFLMGQYKLAMFNSYVSLPKGNSVTPSKEAWRGAKFHDEVAVLIIGAARVRVRQDLRLGRWMFIQVGSP